MNTHETELTIRDRVRVYLTGTCDGLSDLQEALEGHPEIEFIGAAEQVLDASPTLTGGHLQVVLHATRSTTLPANEIAGIREHTRAPIILLASGGSPALLEEALEADVADLLLPPKLAGYTTRHACGLDILPAPLRPEDAELVTEAKLARLLEVARESYDAIIVDTSPFFHGPMLATLDRTDELLLLCGLDVPTIKNVRLSLQTLELLSFPQDRIRIVLNRANSKVGMKKKEVEAALELKVRFEVPSDRAVPLAVNRGTPAVLSDAKADFSRAVREMAKDLVTAQAAAKERRRFLAALARAN